MLDRTRATTYVLTAFDNESQYRGIGNAVLIGLVQDHWVMITIGHVARGIRDALRVGASIRAMNVSSEESHPFTLLAEDYYQDRDEDLPVIIGGIGPRSAPYASLSPILPRIGSRVMMIGSGFGRVREGRFHHETYDFSGRESVTINPTTLRCAGTVIGHQTPTSVRDNRRGTQYCQVAFDPAIWGDTPPHGFSGSPLFSVTGQKLYACGVFVGDEYLHRSTGDQVVGSFAGLDSTVFNQVLDQHPERGRLTLAKMIVETDPTNRSILPGFYYSRKHKQFLRSK